MSLSEDRYKVPLPLQAQWAELCLSPVTQAELKLDLKGVIITPGHQTQSEDTRPRLLLTISVPLRAADLGPHQRHANCAAIMVTAEIIITSSPWTRHVRDV